jgi:hypothetical protein
VFDAGRGMLRLSWPMTLRHETNERIEKLTHRMVDSQGVALLEAGLSIRAEKLHTSIGLGKHRDTEVQDICGSFQRSTENESERRRESCERSGRGHVMNRRVAHRAGVVLLCVYLLLPLFAGVLESDNPRGPLIYPSFYHEIVYTVGRVVLAGKSAPKTPLYGRPLFYGMKRKLIITNGKILEGRGYPPESNRF